MYSVVHRPEIPGWGGMQAEKLHAKPSKKTKRTRCKSGNKNTQGDVLQDPTSGRHRFQIIRLL